MTDKVQKIREEVQRLQSELIQEKEKGFCSETDDACILELQNVLTYIDSLQEEHVSEDLEKVAYTYALKCHPLKTSYGETSPNPEVKDAVIYGANWQKQQDKETIELAEDHAMLAGMEKMKEQMMAKAVEVKVIPADLDETQFCLSDYDEVSYITAMVKAGKLKLLDKVKLIIIKEE